MQGMWAWSLCWEDALEEGLATRSSILAWEIPWTEEPGGLPSMGLQKSWTNLDDWARDTEAPGGTLWISWALFRLLAPFCSMIYLWLLESITPATWAEKHAPAAGESPQGSKERRGLAAEVGSVCWNDKAPDSICSTGTDVWTRFH